MGTGRHTCQQSFQRQPAIQPRRYITSLIGGSCRSLSPATCSRIWTASMSGSQNSRCSTTWASRTRLTASAPASSFSGTCCSRCPAISCCRRSVPADVQPHSRALGHHVGMHALRAERARLLRDAIPARRLRSGLCAGHDLLPVVLVWTVPDGACHRPRVRGRPTWRDCRRPRVGMAHLDTVRRRRPCRLAVDVPRGRTAVHCARPSHAARPVRSARGRTLADRKTKSCCWIGTRRRASTARIHSRLS